jgi:hypothetical protein
MAQRILFLLCYSISWVVQFKPALMKQKQHPKNKATQTRLFGGFKRTQIFIDFLVFFFLQYKSSCPLASDTPGKLDVLGHYSHPLCMDRTQIGILKKTHKVSLGCFLECKNSMALETKISLEVLGNFSNKSLEWQLSDQQLSTLLILTDLTQSNCSRAIAMGLLHSASGRC